MCYENVSLRKSGLRTCKTYFLNTKIQEGVKKGLDKFMAHHSNSALKRKGPFQEDLVALPDGR